MRGKAIAQRIRGVLLALIGVLYIASIPWYRSGGEHASLLFGLPDWVAVAIFCYVAIAILNALAWLLTDVRDPERRDRDVRR